MPPKKSTTAKPKVTEKKPVTRKRKKVVSKKTKTKRATMHANAVHEPMAPMAHVCQSCHALPAGSMELVSLLLVLVFSLSAVLLTSTFALHRQSLEVQDLQAQLSIQQEA